MSRLGGAGLLAVVLAAAVVGGCGDNADSFGESQGQSEALDLVKQLPQDSPVYSTLDLASLKRGLGLPASADPLDDPTSNGFTSQMLNGIFAGIPTRATVDALDLPSATALAFSGPEMGEAITAVATTADLDEIRAALLDQGFVDHDGVLEGPDGERAIPQRHVVSESGTVQFGDESQFHVSHDASAVKFIDGGFLVSDNGELLRSLGETASELPIPLLGSLTGDATFALELDSRSCVTAEGIATNADGTGTLIFEIDGEPDPSKFSGIDSETFGEPEVDGNQLVVPIELDEPDSPRAVQADTFPGYDC